MLTKDFLNVIFINEIEQMTIGLDNYASHPYIGFSLIGSSIEILGACLDGQDWEKTGLSESRFRLAIKDLFPIDYHNYNDKNSPYDLYSNLRCSLSHSLRPGGTIGLSERRHEEKAGGGPAHLVIQNKILILIYEDFLNDFKNASNKVIEMIGRREILNQKVYSHIISVPSDNN